MGGHPQRCRLLKADLLLISCPSSSPPPSPLQELLQGYDTASYQALNPRATLLARIALAGGGIEIQPDPPPPPSPGECRKLDRDALRLCIWCSTGSIGGWLVPQPVARKLVACCLQGCSCLRIRGELLHAFVGATPCSVVPRMP